jgi:hypothetical protein
VSLIIPRLWAEKIFDLYRKDTMGTDVHVWVEKRTDEGWRIYEHHCSLVLYTEALEAGKSADEASALTMDSWKAMRDKYPITSRRNYERFAALASVRGQGREANWWPDDIDPRMQTALSDQDLHSHCWYPLAEAAGIWAATERDEALGTFGAVAPECIYFGVDKDAEDVNDYRVLIAFDN